jgi:hypothetical protein
MLQLAAGRAQGVTFFGADVDAFLSSLAPLVAFALVSGGLVALAGKPRLAMELFLVSVIGMLAPAVIAHPLCRRWQREAYWPLYANILNWARLMFLMLAPMALGVAAAAPGAAWAIGIALMLYVLWFQWFVARTALRLSALRALALMAATQIGSNLLVLLPMLADGGDKVAFAVK